MTDAILIMSLLFLTGLTCGTAGIAVTYGILSRKTS
jgi:hypothetical protein